MRPQTLLLAAVALATSAVAGPETLTAQSEATRLIVGAQSQLEALNNDSAASLLRRALDAQLHATPAERVNAFILLGVTDLVADRATQARNAFRQALELDPTVQVDTLRDLHSDLLRVFAAERERVLRFVVTMPQDTLLASAGGRVDFVVRTSGRGHVTLTISDPRIAGERGVVAVDSAVVDGTGTLRWRVEPPAGGPGARVAYTLRITARDEAGVAATSAVRAVTVEREKVDTQRLPPVLSPSAFASESALVQAHPGGPFARGLFFGAAAASLAYLVVGGEKVSGDRDAKPYVVGGAVAVSGLIGVIKGHRAVRPVPDNILHNQQLREQDTQQRAEIAQANARVRDTAHVRVRITSVLP